MVSRRKILSRSRDDLNLEQPQQDEDENLWFDPNKCFQEHIQEVFLKWRQIDDEIWSKVVVFETNCRVAKAYIRSPVLTINDSNLGFDGYRIGLSGFENSLRDGRTEEVLSRQIGLGCKLRMDDEGSILVKRISQNNVYVKTIDEENAISNEVMRLPSQAIEMGKPIKVFDIRKFEANIERELSKIYPNRAKLEAQCIVPLAFSKNHSQVLQCPSWVMIINIVALDMLKGKLPPARAPPGIRNRPRLPVPEEDPYSLTGYSSGGQNGGKSKPPKLPLREATKSNSKGEYAYIEDSILRPFRSSRKNNNNKESNPKYDDPYYCGLRARTTNFKGSDKDRADMIRGQYVSLQQFPAQQQQPPTLPPPPHPAMYHARGYDQAPMGKPFMPMKLSKFNKVERNPMSWAPNQQQNYESEWENYWVDT